MYHDSVAFGEIVAYNILMKTSARQNIYILFYLNNPKQSSTEKHVVGRNCRVHFYDHVPTGVRDGRNATLLLQVLNYRTINGTKQRT